MKKGEGEAIWCTPNDTGRK